MFTKAVVTSQRLIDASGALLRDLFFLAGVAAVTYGISLWSRPAAWVFGGAAAIAVGVMMEVQAKSGQ